MFGVIDRPHLLKFQGDDLASINHSIDNYMKPNGLSAWMQADAIGFPNSEKSPFAYRNRPAQWFRAKTGAST